MDTLSSQSFPSNVPFKDPIVITHFTFMVLAFFICYPLFLTQQIHNNRHKTYLLGTLTVAASLGFITGSFIQLTHPSTTTILFQLLAIVLFCLFYSHITLTAYKANDFVHSMLDPLLHTLPDWIETVLGWVAFIVALSYVSTAMILLTDSCPETMEQSQCLAPLSMGIGFLIYGTCILLHLLAIIQLPRLSTPEYYEGVIITFWGLLNLMYSETPILGSAWRAINLGLLWFSGGLFSVISSVQTWAPALREKNIINPIILFLTGRAIVKGITQTADAYTLEVHTMLGYILMIGAVTRITQIVFRKSPVDNLPHRMFQYGDEDDEQEEGELLKESTKCKHQFIVASITLVSGILTSFLAITGGLLFMGANVGWLQYMRYYIKDPSTYLNAVLACAFLWCAYIFGLCTLYKTLKMKNAIHPYDYLELNMSTTTVDQKLAYDEEGQDWNYLYEEPTDISSFVPAAAAAATTSPRSSTLVFDNMMMATSPTKTTLTEPDLLQRASSSSFMENTSLTLEKTTLRPSEYRAKRRSLLTQTTANHTIISNSKPSSTFVGGVGGVLPDDINPPDSPLRKSWLSSGSSSSIGYYSGSSAPNSPPILVDNLLYASISSTLPHSHVYINQRGRSNSETGYVPTSEKKDDQVRKTKSGKRKERLQLRNEDEVLSVRTGFQQRWSHQMKK